jgi:uncharacterized membrane protein YbaN (DUF454 family)
MEIFSPRLVHRGHSPIGRPRRLSTRSLHCLKYRIPALLLCILGIVLSWLLPTIVRAIHDAHSMATAHEFQAYRLIDQERLEAIKTEYSMPEYSVEERVRAVGGIHIYLPIVTWILATLFGVIGILVWMADPPSVGTRTGSGVRDDENVQANPQGVASP